MTDQDLSSRFGTMMRIQDDMNRVIHAEWREQGFAWPRAIWAEAAEMLDRTAWKWWKSPPKADLVQNQIELVDIFHFVLSWALQDGVGAPELTRAFTSAAARRPKHALPEDLIDQLARAALHGSVQEAVQAFEHLAHHYELPPAMLFRMYVGKNQLNRLRQAHGYKQGTYIKVWDGKEDNEVLEGVLHEHRDAAPDVFPAKVYATLEQLYRAIERAARAAASPA